ERSCCDLGVVFFHPWKLLDGAHSRITSARDHCFPHDPRELLARETSRLLCCSWRLPLDDARKIRRDVRQRYLFVFGEIFLVFHGSPHSKNGTTKSTKTRKTAKNSHVGGHGGA